ncbi:hypothetical protein GF367_03665 [Candidatus Woesearchaeota archaeon]|nr:hypothetical protein [Candidatus Woesearchaeota archaeon]
MARKRKSVFGQAMDRGPGFSFVFFLFFMMSFLPLALLFVLSLFSYNLPGLALALVMGAVLVRDVRLRRLFSLCRDMAVLNMTLWFLLGFFSLMQTLFTAWSGALTYVLLAPYAVISGYLVYYLLSRSERDEKRVFRGGIAVSTMIAVISAINGAIGNAMNILRERVIDAAESGVVEGVAGALSPSTHNPHLAFLLVLVIFNIPFARQYLKKRHRRGLLLYVIPLMAYALLAGIWSLTKGFLL